MRVAHATRVAGHGECEGALVLLADHLPDAALPLALLVLGPADQGLRLLDECPALHCQVFMLPLQCATRAQPVKEHADSKTGTGRRLRGMVQTVAGAHTPRKTLLVFWKPLDCRRKACTTSSAVTCRARAQRAWTLLSHT